MFSSFFFLISYMLKAFYFLSHTTKRTLVPVNTLWKTYYHHKKPTWNWNCAYICVLHMQVPNSVVSLKQRQCLRLQFNVSFLHDIINQFRFYVEIVGLSNKHLETLECINIGSKYVTFPLGRPNPLIWSGHATVVCLFMRKWSQYATFLLEGCIV